MSRARRGQRPTAAEIAAWLSDRGRKPSEIAAETGLPINRVLRIAHRRKNRARAIAQLAITHGRLIRPDACGACGATGKTEAHHHDYSRPLDVRWLCRSCHVRADVIRRAKERSTRIAEYR